jgi:mxaJ protein
MRGWTLLHWLPVVALALVVPGAEAGQRKPLRVCSDPNNLPFSDEAGAGFEDELALLLGRELRRPVEHVWWAQRRGAIRNTLKAGLCDVIMGVPTALDSLAVTEPYYRSSYVFVTRAAGPDISSFDDQRLRELTVGVQLVGDDYVNTPPVHALSARGISDNLRGYSVLGDYGEKTPASPILRAVQKGELDVAIVWGPLAGHYARQHSDLRLTPTPAADGPLPMRFAIGMGVRKGDQELRRELNRFIAQQQPRIDTILNAYGVPRP